MTRFFLGLCAAIWLALPAHADGRTVKCLDHDHARALSVTSHWSNAYRFDLIQTLDPVPRVPGGCGDDDYMDNLLVLACRDTPLPERIDTPLRVTSHNRSLGWASKTLSAGSRPRR